MELVRLKAVTLSIDLTIEGFQTKVNYSTIPFAVLKIKNETRLALLKKNKDSKRYIEMVRMCLKRIQICSR